MNGLHTEVYKIKDGERTKLTPDCVKTYEVDLKSGITLEKVREMFSTVEHGMKCVGEGMKSVGQGMKSVREGAQALTNVIDGHDTNEENSIGMTSDRPQRSGWKRCNIL